jgi:hypothetical protein
MTQGLSGTAQISGYFNSILEDAIFVARDQMIMPSLVTTYNSGGWEDRKLSVYPQISAETVGETQDFANPTQFDKSAVATLTPAEIMAQVILTDRRIATDPQNARSDASNELGNAISDKIEQDLINLFGSFGGTASSTGGTAAFSLQLVGNAIAKLRVAKMRGPFYVVLNPYHWLDVWNEIGKPSTSLVPADVATSALRDYFVANLVQALWYQHSLVTITSNAATSGVFSREALALDTRKAPTLEPERDASKRAWELNMSAGYAVGVRRAAAGVTITADATAP